MTTPTIFQLHKVFDPMIGMSEEVSFGTAEEVRKYIDEDLEWAETLCGAEVPAVTTLNTSPDGSTFYLVWHFTDGTGAIQADTFTITEADEAGIEAYQARVAEDERRAAESRRDRCATS